MAGPVTRAQLHARLVEALEAMPVEYQGTDFRHADADTWHVVFDSFESGPGLAPAHRAHMSLGVEWRRARRSDEAQRKGRDGLAVIECVVYVQLEYRQGHELTDYRAALDAADLVASTLEGGWHGGAANVDVDTDWDPRWLEGEALMVTPVSCTIRHERMV